MSIPEIIEVIVTPAPEVITAVVEGPQGPPGDDGPQGDPGITVSATAPSSPSTNDLWVDIS